MKKGYRLTSKESMKLYIALSSSDKMDYLPERWQETIERLAIGDTFAQIAKDHEVTMQAVQNWRVKAINKLGFPLYKNGMTIKDLYKRFNL